MYTPAIGSSCYSTLSGHHHSIVNSPGLMQSQKMNMDEGNSAAPSQSEEDITQLVAKTDSFWDIGNYKRVVKRIDDGARLCSDFTKMAQERSEIEAKYVKHLQQWARKWDDLVTKSPEYGSLEVGWKASLKEATKLAEVHLEIQRKILDDIIDSVQTWRSQKYHKSFVNLKETKKPRTISHGRRNPGPSAWRSCGERRRLFIRLRGSLMSRRAPCSMLGVTRTSGVSSAGS